MQGTMEKTESREWVVIENGNQRIFAILHRPLHVENPPLVITMHGFTSSKLGSNRGYVKLAEGLTREGIACLRFDFRGCGDSEGDMSTLTFEDLISDAVAVCRYATCLEGIDTQRIGLFGASLGGAIAILSTPIHHLTKALVLWAPVASGELWYRDFIKEHPELIKVDPAEALGTHRGIKLSPLFREQFGRMRSYEVLGKLSTIPVLHMHGEQDPEISIEHQQVFQKACVHNSSARFLTYSETQHAFGQSTVFPAAMKETINWFKNYL